MPTSSTKRALSSFAIAGLAVAIAVSACKGSCSSSPAPMPPASETKPIADASNAFALDLWARVGKQPGNQVFSPASVSLAIAATWAGANGETAAEIAKTMHFSGEPSATLAAWGHLATALSSSRRANDLRIANRLFGEKSLHFEQPYRDMIATSLGAPLESVDFKNAPEPARVHINDWVEKQTNQHISGLLPSGAVRSETRFVIVNAIYFLGDWLIAFDKRWTADAPFATSPTTKVKVPTMTQHGEYPFAKGDGVRILGLPYAGNEVLMYIVLPDKQDGLAAIESSLTPANLEAWTTPGASAELDLTLPRFKLTPPPLSLRKELAALGMEHAFQHDRADFTGIAKLPNPNEHLVIDEILHKAFIKVDEEGTEAAAATAVVGVEATSVHERLVFNVDHPFLFFIVDRASKVVLFMGRVADPSAS